VKKNQLIILSFLVLSLFIVTSAYSKKNNNPFDRIWETVNKLIERVTTIEEQNYQAQIYDLETMIYELEDRIKTVEDNPTSVSFPEPDYDSGWVPLNNWPFYATLTHNLGTYDIFIYIIGGRGGVPGEDEGARMHQIGLFGDKSNPGTTLRDDGVEWNAKDENSIFLIRGPTDQNWDYGRVFIWKIPPT
jgi:uncharacterized protein YdcH (DUF465 family)